MENVRNACILALAMIACIIDIVFSGNGFVQLFLVLASSFVIFYMSSLPIRLNKLSFSLIFAINILIIVFTYNYKILLINILILAFLLWKLITPKLLKFKNLLPITIILSFVAVYFCSLLKFSIPLFLLVLYPIYILGTLVCERKIQVSAKNIIFSITVLVTSGAALSAFLFKSIGLSILGSISFLTIFKSGTVTAVYLPFIAVFLTIFLLALNLIFYIFCKKFISKKSYINSFDLSVFIKPFTNFILFFIIVFGVAFICEFSIRQNISQTFSIILDPHILFNVMLLGGIYLLLISLIGKGISNILIVLLTIFLTVANSIKITYFNEPFYPWDLYLVRNLIGISKEYLSLPLILLTVALLSLVIFLIVKFRKSIGTALKPRVSLFLIPFAVILILINAYVLGNKASCSQLNIQKSWYTGKVEIFTNGMFVQNYFYITDLDKYLAPKPAGYGKSKIQGINKKYKKDNESINKDVNPDIVMVMSESFWDISQLEGLKFSKDIAPNVHKYQKGTIAPSSIGGGTANTEFETLTGMSMYFISPGVIPYNVYLRTETPSIASVFKAKGYRTVAIHPNSAWFYNRDKVYKYFGFDEYIDISQFDLNTQAKGPHISDDALVDKILSTLEKSDKPTFIFAVSMQNHDPYMDRYNNFDVSVDDTTGKLSATEINIIKNYSQGIYDADKSFGKLVDTLDKNKKPSLLYFYGDHAPRLGSLQDFYSIYDKINNPDKLDDDLGRVKYYRTPLATWSNFSDMKSFPEIISPAHLSYEILKDSGIDYPNYFNVLPEVAKLFPLMHTQQMGAVDLKNSTIMDYQQIQYDLLFGSKYLLK